MIGYCLVQSIGTSAVPAASSPSAILITSHVHFYRQMTLWRNLFGSGQRENLLSSGEHKFPFI